MLSYQHVFHAGNHADILKHMVLLSVLDSLKKKEKPYTYYDTHSGSGLYDLQDNRSQKTGEAENGIIKLNKLIAGVDKIEHKALIRYLETVKFYTDKGLYPGSPELARVNLREQDFEICSELHPQEIENLRNTLLKSPVTQNISNEANIQVHNRNGFEMLKALTPAKTKRGAVLIDPSYEETKDYYDVASTICAVNKKWSNGIIMLWYPLLAHRESEIQNMLNNICLSAKEVNQNVEISRLEFLVNSKDSHKETSLEEYQNESLDKKNPPRLYGSGMLVINSPWKLEEEITKEINYLEDFFFLK